MATLLCGYMHLITHETHSKSHTTSFSMGKQHRTTTFIKNEDGSSDALKVPTIELTFQIRHLK